MAEEKEKETEENKVVPPQNPQEDPWFAKLKQYPLQELKKKGWKTRIKTKPDGKQYITLTARIKDDDGKYHSTDRSIGPYTLEKWKYVTSILPTQEKKERIIARVLEDIVNSEVEPENAELVEKLENDAELDQKREGMRNESLPEETEGTQNQDELEQPKVLEKDVALPDKKIKMFTTVVARSGAIPPSISYSSDIVTYFEYFQAKGYVGNINDWMHELARNYLAEHYCKMHVEMGKPESENIE
jgi:hypothetical protein